MANSISRRNAGLLLTGCAISLSAQQTAGDLERVQVGAEAPGFELPSLEGGKLSLASLRGKNVVLVFYRGYW
ncbi:MAG: hypothetical protein OHK0021_17770 [Bryobacter sp.]